MTEFKPQKPQVIEKSVRLRGVYYHLVTSDLMKNDSSPLNNIVENRSIQVEDKTSRRVKKNN